MFCFVTVLSHFCGSLSVDGAAALASVIRACVGVSRVSDANSFIMALKWIWRYIDQLAKLHIIKKKKFRSLTHKIINKIWIGMLK